MKVKFLRSSVILTLIIANICLAALVIFITYKISEVRVSNLNITSADHSFSFLPSSINKQINLDSRAYIVYDADSREIVAGKNEKLRFAPASSAKIMATLISLENFELDQVLTARNMDKIGSDNSKMHLVEGENITVENLLYGMMLPSGNDAAFVLAQSYPSGVSGFVKAMNKKAKKLGLLNTYFVDPDGYEDSNYTTAYDLARLGAHAMKNKTFAKIVGTKYKYVSDITGKIPHNLQNLNILLGKNGVNGIKTGFTDEAGGVLVTSIKTKDKNYIVVVLGSKDRFLDTKNVMDNALSKIRTLFY